MKEANKADERVTVKGLEILREKEFFRYSTLPPNLEKGMLGGRKKHAHHSRIFF